MKEVPIWEKSNLTLDEAAAYFGIGIHKIREITDHNSYLLIYCGNKRLIKRRLMDEYLEKMYSI